MCMLIGPLTCRAAYYAALLEVLARLAGSPSLCSCLHLASPSQGGHGELRMQAVT